MQQEEKEIVADPMQEKNLGETEEEDDGLLPFHTKQASLAMLYLLFCSVLMVSTFQFRK